MTPKGAWPRSRVLLLKQWDRYPRSTERISCYNTVTPRDPGLLYTPLAPRKTRTSWHVNMESFSACPIPNTAKSSLDGLDICDAASTSIIFDVKYVERK